jgi:hypothetical protein
MSLTKATYSMIEGAPANVQDYGAVGDNSANDLSAIQAAVDAVIAAGGGTVIIPPDFICKISGGSIQISDARKCNIVGFGRNTSKIIQHTANTPIIRYLNCASVSGGGTEFHIRGLWLGYNTPSLTTDTDANAIRFETGTGDPTFGYYNFNFSDIRFDGVYRGITNNYATPPNVWGWTWDNLYFHDFAKGGIYLTNGGAGGSPNCTARSWYFIGRSALTYTDAFVFCDSADGWSLEALEFNLCNMNANAMIYISGARSVKIKNIRIEVCTFTTSATQAIIFAENVRIGVEGVSAGPITVNAGVTVAVLRLGSAAFGMLDTVQPNTITGAGIMTCCLEGSAGALVFFANAAESSGQYVKNGGYFAPLFSVETAGPVGAQMLVTGGGGLGYGTGSGGAVTQATSRTTGVTLNKTNGAITLFSAAGSTAWQTFVVTNSTVAATDVVQVSQKSGTDLNMIHVTRVAAGAFDISFATTGGVTVEQPVFNFAVIKAVAA